LARAKNTRPLGIVDQFTKDVEEPKLENLKSHVLRNSNFCCSGPQHNLKRRIRWTCPS